MKETETFILECLQDLSRIDLFYAEEHWFEYHIADTVSHLFWENVWIGSLAVMVQLLIMSGMPFMYIADPLVHAHLKYFFSLLVKSVKCKWSELGFKI